MAKTKIQCRIFQSTATIDLEEQVNTWLEEMSKDSNFELLDTDQETTTGINTKMTITIFYKTGGKKQLLEKAEEAIRPKKEN